MLAYDLPYPYEDGEALHLLNRKGMAYTCFPRLATGLLVPNA